MSDFSLPDFIAMLQVELLKLWRSRVPLFTLLGFLIVPLVDIFFMIILRDPDSARRAGLISAKAQMIAGTADWPTFLSFLAQAVSVGGVLLFGMAGSWVFGREFVDGAVKDWLAVPIGRAHILLAKFVVVILWSLAMTVVVYIVAVILGLLLGLPQGTAQLFWQGTGTIFVTALLVVSVMTPVAFFASIGRGYLLPMGVMLLFVLFANVLAVAGWGSYFPWAIPALYARAGDRSEIALEAISYWIVFLTALAGVALTYLWWRVADQNK
jgi:ABC-2 type transport system permease protein